MGRYGDLYPPIADRSALVDGTSGVEVFGPLAPEPGEHVIKRPAPQRLLRHGPRSDPAGVGHHDCRITGTTTDNCCHATARDAMFNNYNVIFLSDATGTFDYPDVGQVQ